MEAYLLLVLIFGGLAVVTTAFARSLTRTARGAGPTSPRARRWASVVAVLAWISVLVACAPIVLLVAFVSLYHAGQPDSYVTLTAVQSADDRLRIWLGDDCRPVGSLRVELRDVRETRLSSSLPILDVWRLRATANSHVPPSVLAVGQVAAGFVETDPVRQSWRDAEAVRVSFDGSGGEVFFLDGDIGTAEDHAGEWYVLSNDADEIDGFGDGWQAEEWLVDTVESDDVHPICPAE